MLSIECCRNAVCDRFRRAAKWVVVEVTLALLGGQKCKTPEEYKAWAQNLGHEDVLTFRSYGDVSSYRQTEIMRSFASPTIGVPG